VNFRRSVIIAGLWRPKVAIPGNLETFLRFFWKNDRLRWNVQSSVPKASSPYRSTSLCWNFVKFGRREIVRYLPDKKQNFVCLPNCRYCADRAQNPPGPAPNSELECSRFHPNWFAFGGVIAEYVNTNKSRPKEKYIQYSAEAYLPAE